MICAVHKDSHTPAVLLRTTTHPTILGGGIYGKPSKFKLNLGLEKVWAGEFQSETPAVILKAHSVFSVYHSIVRRMPLSKVCSGRHPSDVWRWEEFIA